MFRPEIWEARHVCEQAALDKSAHPQFARIVETGEVNRTQNGYYVNDLIVGEMAEKGDETKRYFSCYIDMDGQLIKSHRRPYRRNALKADSANGES